MGAFLQVRAVSKSFDSHSVLRAVSFDVQSGQSVAIVGPSGCGKSTLLNILGLLESPDEGAILLRGQAYPDTNSREAMMMRRLQINYLFQSFALLDSRSVRDNLLLGLHYTRMPREQKLARIQESLASFGLADRLDDTVNQLSGGQKQRVAICRAMLKPGDLILADEPTGSLDARMASKVMDALLGSARHQNKTLVVVTHNLLMAQKCDRVLNLGGRQQAV